ncbi:hypothetical protein [Microbacterium hatanonis]|uniref:Oligosaccharide flippase family protein n=1 Tax=Microbacterium hatanonis TaxID=404366 RepID=A0A5C8HYB6_9MICO|nr:hypothetical protein [Microbacterium hatanonis]TXK10320.1 hypothetical protein FVP77_15865 [Microbacterium hatanonis]
MKGFSSFALLRVFAQVLTFAAGVIVVRILPPDQYALYAIAAALIAAITAISATGITSRFMALGAALERPSMELDLLYGGARSARLRLVTVVLVVALPFLAYLLISNGADPLAAVGILVLCVLSTVPLQQFGLASTELQLEKRFVLIGAIDVIANGVRALSVTILWILGVSSAVVLFSVTAFVAWTQAVLGWRSVRRYVRARVGVDPSSRRTFAIAVRQSLPAVLVMVASEQLVTLLLTLSGNTLGIAQVAALSRYALAFALVNNILGTWGASALARTVGGRGTVLRASGRYLAVYGAACLAFLSITVIFSGPLLHLLGESYEQLTLEFALLMAGATLTNFAAFGIGAINHARGYLSLSWVYIPFVVAWLVIGMTFVDTSSSLGAAILAASLAVPTLLGQLARAIYGIWNHTQSDVE